MLSGAVASDDGGDTVLDLGEHVGVEQQLGVDVRVWIDESRSDDLTAGVDDATPR